MPYYTVFDTSIGACAIAWSRKGVVRFLLPDATAAETEASMLRACPGAGRTTPRGWVAELVLRVQRHLGGAADDFADVPLDTRDLPPFHAAVYDALRKVHAGATTTYGALGRKISGTTGAARAVGVAMAKNPFALLVPCHRVVGSDGKLHGFSAPGGLATKARLLAIEGRPVPQQGSLFGDPARPVGEETASRRGGRGGGSSRDASPARPPTTVTRERSTRRGRRGSATPAG